MQSVLLDPSPRLEQRVVDTRAAVTDALNRVAHLLESLPYLPGVSVYQAPWG